METQSMKLIMESYHYVKFRQAEAKSSRVTINNSDKAPVINGKVDNAGTH